MLTVLQIADMNILFTIKSIYSGWKNYYVKDPEVEEKAKQRLVVCYNCPTDNLETMRLKKYKNANKLILFLSKIPLVMNITYTGCLLCGCPIEKVVRSKKGKCKDKHW